MDPRRRGVATSCVWGDDECLVAVPAQVLENPEHRVRHAIDVGQERFCNDGYTHNSRVAGRSHGTLTPR